MNRQFFALLLIACITTSISAMNSSWEQAYLKALRKLENRFEAGSLKMQDAKVALGDNMLGGRSSIFDASAALALARKIRPQVIAEAQKIVQMGKDATPEQKENIRAALIFIRSQVANVEDFDAQRNAENLLNKLQN